MGLSLTHANGKLVVSKDAARDKSQMYAEQSQMFSYLADGVAALHSEQQVSLTVDCTSCSGRELLSLAVDSQTSTAEGCGEFAMWLPPQDSIASGCILCVCAVHMLQSCYGVLHA